MKKKKGDELEEKNNISHLKLSPDYLYYKIALSLEEQGYWESHLPPKCYSQLKEHFISFDSWNDFFQLSSVEISKTEIKEEKNIYIQESSGNERRRKLGEKGVLSFRVRTLLFDSLVLNSNIHLHPSTPQLYLQYSSPSSSSSSPPHKQETKEGMEIEEEEVKLAEDDNKVKEEKDFKVKLHPHTLPSCFQVDDMYYTLEYNAEELQGVMLDHPHYKEYEYLKRFSSHPLFSPPPSPHSHHHHNNDPFLLFPFSFPLFLPSSSLHFL